MAPSSQQPRSFSHSQRGAGTSDEDEDEPLVEVKEARGVPSRRSGAPSSFSPPPSPRPDYNTGGGGGCEHTGGGGRSGYNGRSDGYSRHELPPTRAVSRQAPARRAASNYCTDSNYSAAPKYSAAPPYSGSNYVGSNYGGSNSGSLRGAARGDTGGWDDDETELPSARPNGGRVIEMRGRRVGR